MGNVFETAGAEIERSQRQRILRDPRWQVVLDRDPTADGVFVYAVSTTGIYCRPTCPSRRPSPDKVAFFATSAEAESAGYRPCLRCRPAGKSPAAQQRDIVKSVCRYIESCEQVPALSDLARHAGISPAHLHRLFKASTGVTPHAYAAANRSKRVRRELRNSGSVSEAIYAAGYGSGGRFYEESDRLLGMTAGSYRDGGKETKILFAVGECSLGSILVASSERGVCAITLGNDPEALVRELEEEFPAADLIGGDAEFERLVSQVVGLVERPGVNLDLPLDIRGTAFQQKVWQALKSIPAGEKLSYAALAERIGSPRAVRAVAGACAANRLAVAIPCHRIVRSDGSLSGYRWGVERKRELLRRERDGHDLAAETGKR